MGRPSRYSPEFREQAVELVTATGTGQRQREHASRREVLRRRLADFAPPAGHQMPDSARSPRTLSAPVSTEQRPITKAER